VTEEGMANGVETDGRDILPWGAAGGVCLDRLVEAITIYIE